MTEPTPVPDQMVLFTVDEINQIKAAAEVVQAAMSRGVQLGSPAVKQGGGRQDA